MDIFVGWGWEGQNCWSLQKSVAVYSGPPVLTKVNSWRPDPKVVDPLYVLFVLSVRQPPPIPSQDKPVTESTLYRTRSLELSFPPS